MSASLGQPAAGRDAEFARQFLVERFGDSMEMEPDLPQGEWSRVYAFRHGGRDLVVRFNADRHSFDIDRMALRFASPQLPIPELVEAGTLDDGFYAISERVFGEFLEELTPEAMVASAPSVLAVLDAMRTADVGASAGLGPWNPDGDGHYASWQEYLVRNLENEVPGRSRADWSATLEATDVANRAFEAGMEALEGLVAHCPDQRSVVHSDLLNRNVFAAGGCITGIIDWQCAMYGDFLYDLAWLTFWAPWHKGVEAADFRARTLAHYRHLGVEVLAFAERMRCYEIHIGLRHLIYQAWRRAIGNLEATARRTLEVIG